MVHTGQFERFLFTIPAVKTVGKAQDKAVQSISLTVKYRPCNIVCAVHVKQLFDIIFVFMLRELKA